MDAPKTCCKTDRAVKRSSQGQLDWTDISGSQLRPIDSFKKPQMFFLRRHFLKLAGHHKHPQTERLLSNFLPRPPTLGSGAVDPLWSLKPLNGNYFILGSVIISCHPPCDLGLFSKPDQGRSGRHSHLCMWQVK